MKQLAEIANLTTRKETLPCEKCGFPFEAVITVLCGEPFGVRVCAACWARRGENAAAHAKNDAGRAHETAWQRVCPATYRDTDPKRLPESALRLAAAWAPRAGRGIGLTGETGAGKTRALFLALRRAHDSGLSVEAVSHNRFSRLAQDAFMGEKQDDARQKLRDYHRAAVLLLDDLGKAPRTERADAEIEELVEHRTSAGLPVLWTANASGEWLIKRFGEDRGPALVRRLAEFCDCLAL